MKRLFYIFLLVPFLAACSDEAQDVRDDGEGTLIITDIRLADAGHAVVQTRSAVDPDLAIEILAADGNVYRGYSYAANATLPEKFALIPGSYTLHAYSENSTSWTTDNGGLGSAVYDASQAFTVQTDWVTYVDLAVPMINYGVTYTVPEGFGNWFPTCDFTVTADGRTCPLTPSQTAYFDPANAEGFTYTLHLVNTDGEEYDVGVQNYRNPKAGLVYNINVTFASDDDPTKLRIGISYDDTYEEIVSDITLY